MLLAIRISSSRLVDNFGTLPLPKLTSSPSLYAPYSLLGNSLQKWIYPKLSVLGSFPCNMAPELAGCPALTRPGLHS